MSLEPSYLSRALEEWQARLDEVDWRGAIMDAALRDMDRAIQVLFVASACAVLSFVLVLTSMMLFSVMVLATIGLMIWSTVVFTRAHRTFREQQRIVRALLGMEQK